MVSSANVAGLWLLSLASQVNAKLIDQAAATRSEISAMSKRKLKSDFFMLSEVCSPWVLMIPLLENDWIDLGLIAGIIPFLVQRHAFQGVAKCYV